MSTSSLSADEAAVPHAVVGTDANCYARSDSGYASSSSRSRSSSSRRASKLNAKYSAKVDKLVTTVDRITQDSVKQTNRHVGAQKRRRADGTEGSWVDEDEETRTSKRRGEGAERGGPGGSVGSLGERFKLLDPSAGRASQEEQEDDHSYLKISLDVSPTSGRTRTVAWDRRVPSQLSRTPPVSPNAWMKEQVFATHSSRACVCTEIVPFLQLVDAPAQSRTISSPPAWLQNQLSEARDPLTHSKPSYSPQNLLNDLTSSENPPQLPFSTSGRQPSSAAASDIYQQDRQPLYEQQILAEVEAEAESTAFNGNVEHFYSLPPELSHESPFDGHFPEPFQTSTSPPYFPVHHQQSSTIYEEELGHPLHRDYSPPGHVYSQEPALSTFPLACASPQLQQEDWHPDNSWDSPLQSNSANFETSFPIRMDDYSAFWQPNPQAHSELIRPKRRPVNLYPDAIQREVSLRGTIDSPARPSPLERFPSQEEPPHSSLHEFAPGSQGLELPVFDQRQSDLPPPIESPAWFRQSHSPPPPLDENTCTPRDPFQIYDESQSNRSQRQGPLTVPDPSDFHATPKLDSPSIPRISFDSSLIFPHEDRNNGDSEDAPAEDSDANFNPGIENEFRLGPSRDAGISDVGEKSVVDWESDEGQVYEQREEFTLVGPDFAIWEDSFGTGGGELQTEGGREQMEEDPIQEWDT